MNVHFDRYIQLLRYLVSPKLFRLLQAGTTVSGCKFLQLSDCAFALHTDVCGLAIDVTTWDQFRFWFTRSLTA